MSDPSIKTVIALTMGDPAGVGPEICLQALAHTKLVSECILVIIGDSAVLKAASIKTGIPFTTNAIPLPDWTVTRFSEHTVVNIGAITVDDFTPGTISGKTGRAGYNYVNTAIDAGLAGAVDAISTTPLNKEAMRMDGIKFPGHTEILASRTNAEHSC
ncbi:4-hydroxythreonine-4-phosphate dehydrogenase PdxA, partial [Verrucomicrobia bacterium]|nr:4-hydroxythreonine-4-phosphate dehydrogenase PdxA [Verrucomicrobiota bacterium]